MPFRSNRRAAAFKVYQLAVFISELQNLVVRDVCCRLLRLAYLSKLQIQPLLGWPINILFDKIVIFGW